MPHPLSLSRRATAVWAPLFAAGVSALLSACACAQPAGGHPPPPPEALAACQAAAAGKACSFSSPQGELSGSCWAPEGKPLACRPTNPPKGAPKDAPSGSGAKP